MIKIFIIITVLLLGNKSLAAEWVPIKYDKNNKPIVYIDKETQKRNGCCGIGTAEAWIAFMNYKNKTIQGKMVNRTIDKTTVDCGKRLISTEASITYGNNNEILTSYDHSFVKKKHFDSVIPGTLGESILEYLCK